MIDKDFSYKSYLIHFTTIIFANYICLNLKMLSGINSQFSGVTINVGDIANLAETRQLTVPKTLQEKKRE